MLSGEYVALRAIEETDLEKLLVWRNDPSLRRYFREYRELNYSQQLSWFNDKVNDDPSTIMFSIINKENEELIGACGLCYVDWVNRTADFSIYLGADDIYIDDKYAPDAARLMMQYAFDELSLNRLWAEIYSFDTKKFEFFKSLDFELEGTHRQTHWAEGKWHNSYFFGYIKSDGEE